MINDRYKIIKKAGEGRSKVFLCEDTLQSDRQFAIKILPASVNNEERKSFRDEYHLLKKLNHPNIINVFEFGTIVSLDNEDKESGIFTGSKFFTLEYFDGNELYEFPNIKNESCLWNIICEISSVLYYLHQSAYIYYDLKSENILVKDVEGKPVIKFIDFGLTSHIFAHEAPGARGTSEYIAPEILRNEKIDHRVDLYSLGILLYKIIYNKFPFSVPDKITIDAQLTIYKAHLEGQFDFPVSQFNARIVNLVRKLLSRDLEQRPFTSVGIIEAFDPADIKNYKNEWTRIPVFAGRVDALSVITTYIEKGDRGEVLIVKGAEGAGKSTLLNELNYKYEDSVLVAAGQNNERDLWQSLLRNILYKENIFSVLNEEAIQTGKVILNGRSRNLLEDLKALFIKLSSAGNFILLIDDFNLLSDFDLDILLQLIPLLQINKIKIVITEDSAGKSSSSRINNLQFINLNPFTEAQVAEFVNSSYASFFPRNEIKKTIMIYSDLLPGNIEEFLKDLIVLNLLEYFSDGPVMNIGSDFDKTLKGSQEEIYQLRLNDIDNESKNLAVLLSMFNISPDIGTITGLTGETGEHVNLILERLSEANIIQQSTILNCPQFTSLGLKEYIYRSIKNKRQEHLRIANNIELNILSFDRSELSRHLELAGEFERTYEVLKEEIEKAGNASALAYKKSILQHLIQLPLNPTSQRSIKTELCNCLFQMGDLNACKELADDLLINSHSIEEEVSLTVLKGNALIDLKLLTEGIEVLKSVLAKIKENNLRNEVLAKIAEAEYHLAEYDEAEKIADTLLRDGSITLPTKGKVYQVKGLIQLFNYNNPKEAIDYFEKSLEFFKKDRRLDKVASMENNIANIYHIIGNKDGAEKHWNKAIALNRTIGDIQQQGAILINFGIYFFSICNFDKSIEQYQQAMNIFKVFGDRYYLGLANTNLGEVNLIVCEYEKAISALNESINIFNEVGIVYEKFEALFILGKLYFELGHSSKLLNLNKEFEEDLNSEDSKKLSDKLCYLKLLSELLITKKIENTGRFYETKSKLKENSDHFNYCNLEILLIENLILLKQFDDAINEINDNVFIKFSDENIYFKAYRNYLLGKISENLTNRDLEPAINYYLNAYESIKDISITELTIQIINSLYDLYFARGNVSKVNEYAKYLDHLISYISGQLIDEELRESYLGKRNIKEILNKINK